MDKKQLEELTEICYRLEAITANTEHDGMAHQCGLSWFRAELIGMEIVIFPWVNGAIPVINDISNMHSRLSGLITRIEQLEASLSIFADRSNWLRPLDDETIPAWMGPSVTTEEIDRRPWDFAKSQINAPIIYPKGKDIK